MGIIRKVIGISGVGLMAAGAVVAYPLAHQEYLTPGTTFHDISLSQQFSATVKAGQQPTVEAQKAAVNMQTGLEASLGFFTGTTLLAGALGFRRRTKKTTVTEV